MKNRFLYALRFGVFSWIGAILVTFLMNPLFLNALSMAKERNPDDPIGSAMDKEENPPAPKGQVFYKWSNERGDLYFTDDLMKVPRQYRSQVEIIELPPVEEERETRANRDRPSQVPAPP